MPREVVKLHTIQQWNSVSPAIRSAVLGQVKLKDRLEQYLGRLNGQPTDGLTQAKWVPCDDCNPKERAPQTRGYVLHEPRYPGIHPSQISTSNCNLKLFYELIGAPSEEHIEPRKRLVFDFGKALHKLLQSYGLKGAWGNPEEYVPEDRADVHPDAELLQFEGHCDANHIYPVDALPGPIYEVGVVHEYKSINHGQFGMLRGAKPEHKKQANIYAHLLDRPVVAFLYMDKDNSALVQDAVAYDPAGWEGIRRRALTIVEASGPPRGDPGMACGECKYQRNCPDYAAQSRRR
jgi:hypothetical protein